MIWRVAEGSPGGLRKGGGRSSIDLTLPPGASLGLVLSGVTLS